MNTQAVIIPLLALKASIFLTVFGFRAIDHT